MILVKS